jgi:(3,5-dihydroxyphenyl)acetyl-CoA 1,2-dioxygenase
MIPATELDTCMLRRAGLSAGDVEAWIAATSTRHDTFGSSRDAIGGFLTRGEDLLARLPPPARRTPAELAAAVALRAALGGARDEFLGAHVDQLYDLLTGGGVSYLRLEELVYRAAELVPGLVPTRAQMKAERALALSEKRGLELAQGQLAAHLLGSVGSGLHLIEAMHRPTPEAGGLLGEFRRRGSVDLGPVFVRRHGRAAILELRNPRHLNAEDGVTLGPTEVAVDLVLLDPETEVAVMRGGVVEHPRYAGERVFGSGINLTHLYRGRIDFLFYLVRDLGYVSKIYRGVSTGEGSIEKLWIAAVERYAIGGACQLLHVMDHVIATRGSRLYLPARQEGIIPGASNLRLPRFVGDRAARQAILSGREWTAGDPDAALLCDETIEPAEMDAALVRRIEALTSSGLVNAAANRKALRVGQEPIEIFRQYMSTYAREQALCHLSPALVRNLEQHWDAGRREL